MSRGRDLLRQHVTGAIERGEAEPVVAVESGEEPGPTYVNPDVSPFSVYARKGPGFADRRAEEDFLTRR